MSDERIVVADAGAILSLQATGLARMVIPAVSTRFVITDVVAMELRECRRWHQVDEAEHEHLFTAKLVQIVQLSAVAIDIFEPLVVGTAAATLDDGEAATIACAWELGGNVLSDDPKLARICREEFPQLIVRSTPDLLLDPDLLRDLGGDMLVEAVARAVSEVRMQLSTRHMSRLRSLVDEKRFGQLFPGFGCGISPRRADLPDSTASRGS